MNSKLAKHLRDLTGFDPKAERAYKNMELLDINGTPYKSPVSIKATSARADYQTLKKYVKGQDVILPIHLQKIIAENNL